MASKQPLRDSEPQLAAAAAAEMGSSPLPAVTHQQQCLKTGLNSLPSELLLEIFGCKTCSRDCSCHPEHHLLCKEFQPCNCTSGQHEPVRHVFRKLSLVSKRFRLICIPKVFEKLKVGSPEHELPAFLGQVMSSAYILPTVRTLSISSLSSRQSTFCDEPYPCPCNDSLAATTFQVLNGMPNLVEVKLSLRHDTFMSSSLRMYCKQHDDNANINTSFPRVKSLELMYPQNLGFFLTDVFTNLVMLHIKLRRETTGLGALKSLVKLKALSLGGDKRGPRGWCLDDVTQLQQSVPGLRCLVLDGQLYDTPISDLVDTLAQFPHLQFLALPNVRILPRQSLEGGTSARINMLALANPIFDDSPDWDAEEAGAGYTLKVYEDNRQNANDLFGNCPELQEIAFLDPSRPWIAAAFAPTIRHCNGEDEVEVRWIADSYGGDGFPYWIRTHMEEFS